MSAEELQRKIDELLKILGERNSSVCNRQLAEELKLGDDDYREVREEALKKELVERWRGRGGSLRLVSRDSAAGAIKCESDVGATTVQVDSRTPEEVLYDPVLKMLSSAWASEYQLGSEWKVWKTAKQGRRDTGGVWTRPDITAVNLKSFAYLPKQYIFDVWTFEVKPADSFDVMGLHQRPFDFFTFFALRYLENRHNFATGRRNGRRNGASMGGFGDVAGRECCANSGRCRG